MNMMKIGEFDTGVQIKATAPFDNEAAQALLANLQPSIWGNAGSGARAVGVVWNGVSDLAVEDDVVKVQDARI